MSESEKTDAVAKPKPNPDQVFNSLSTVIDALNLGGIFNGLNRGGTAGVMSSTASQYLNLRYYLISNDRNVLSQMYAEHGLIQTLIDLPVDDAFRAGYEIKSGQLDADEMELLQNWMKSSGAWDAYVQATKWKRLFGGAGVMMITSQKANTAFNIEQLNKFSRIEFRAADMWELYYNKVDMHETTVTKENVLDGLVYDYYGVQIDPSRVLKLVGREPPSYIKMQLRGWGMSVVDPIIRSLNQYFKNQDVIFDLLDEAKIDIYKIDGFNSSLSNADAIQTTIKRIQSANALKNYNNAITMDMEDDYAQKEITFTGLADMLEQIRQGVASDFRMPMTKLFGQSAKGFSSGEEDTENYNAMLESEIRSKSSNDVIKLLQIGCKLLFDFVPDDMQIHFNPLKVISAIDLEKVKDSQWKRTKEAYENGLAQDTEAKESINKAGLLPSEIDEKAKADDPLSAKSAMTIAKNAPKDNTQKPKLRAVK